MSLSRRSLLTNYYTSISKEYDGTTKEIYEHDNKYLISEDNNGTIIKTSTIFNGIEILPELIENNLSYVVVDEDLIDYNTILNILDIVSNIIQGKNVEKNILYVAFGDDPDTLYSDSCIIDNINFIASKHPAFCTAKFRYRQKDIEVSLEWLNDDEILVKYPQGVKSVTPGQACVFYDGDICLGGGIIKEVRKNGEKLWYL